jgi:RimK family alpha-L-glutamate ligase
MSKKILIIVGGGIKHLAPFAVEAQKLGLDVTLAGFGNLEYSSEGEVQLKVKGQPVENFDVIYIRLVGKRFEDASLLVNYAREKGIKIVDKMYEKSHIIRLPLAKSLEAKLLINATVPMPKTYFGSLKKIKEEGPKLFGYPFVIKGTQGKQGHAVWSPKDPPHLDELYEELKDKEKKGGRFLAQEFIKASQRNRIFVIGDSAVAAITRPTRWRKRFLAKVGGEFPTGKREALMPVPEEDVRLALKATHALDVDIAGVDVIHEDSSGKAYVLEVNSAPRWESIAKDTGVNVEREILKFLV